LDDQRRLKKKEDLKLRQAEMILNSLEEQNKSDQTKNLSQVVSEVDGTQL
jgi:hypothetical protein